jgi:hypothetical protein
VGSRGVPVDTSRTGRPPRGPPGGYSTSDRVDTIGCAAPAVDQSVPRRRVMSEMGGQNRRSDSAGTRATDLKLIPALVDLDGDHGLLVAHQVAEEISQNF